MHARLYARSLHERNPMLHDVLARVRGWLSLRMPTTFVPFTVEQDVMRRRLEDQEQRLQGLRAELQLIRRQIEELDPKDRNDA